MKSIKNINRYMMVWFIAAALMIPAARAAQGTSPDTWTKKELKEAILNAKTADDHNNIARYYKHEADRLDVEAKEHSDLAEAYSKSPTYHEQKHPMSGQTAGHCQWLAKEYRQMAQKDRDLATMHETMAKNVTQ